MNSKLPGKLIIFGVLQFAFLMLIAEFIYPGYSVARNYISDLGVGPEPSRAIFTISIIFFGASLLIATYLLWKGGSDKIFSVVLALAGIGLIGVGLFNEIDHTPLHILSALLAFGFGGIAAVSSSRLSKPPFSYVSIFLGLMSLIALVLLLTRKYLDLGAGGMERMVAYPIIFWAIGFSAYLMHPAEQESAL
ncbi:MAG: DUF998 domain-containing protein [Methanotrichaceae archaeon]|nr:DUF998 domain-containing protein [Methanotrichaceae archaeon]